jgi:pimeloyl-ACP methyl ester carboxylesterase
VNRVLCSKNSVTSRDGTVIGYRYLGAGPGLILVHGGMKSGLDFMRLAQALSACFTVYLPDRRGRGLSGSHGEQFSLMREVEDLQALMAQTGAVNLFGLSVGALVVLKTALLTPAVRKAALYEPPLNLDGCAPTGWVPRYEADMAQGRLAAATVTAVKGTRTQPLFNRLPRFVLVPVMALVMRLQGPSTDDAVTIRSLIPTMHFEMRNISEMRDSLADFRSVRIPVLLLGGGKSPVFFRTILDALERTLPRASRKVFAALGHDGPEDDGKPELVAHQLKDFFGGG